MVGFFGGVGYFGMGFFGDVVQVVGVVVIFSSDWFDGLCMYGSVDGLMVCVCVCVCVCGSVCVVMDLDKLIGVSWFYACVWLCVLNQC